MATWPLVLASRSPRRAALLRAARIDFEPGPAPDVDETPPPGLAPAGVALGLAQAKARAVLGRVAAGRTVLTADTVVALDGVLLGKPNGAADALRMLRLLRGQTHDVFTAVAVARGGRVRADVAQARVRVDPVPDAVLGAYAASGEPLDKAGGYGIQGEAGAFVRLVAGDLDTVIGLPIALLRRLLDDLERADPVPP